MTDSALTLLAEARKVLERYMFEGETCRDDVAEICQKIDDVLPYCPNIQTTHESRRRTA